MNYRENKPVLRLLESADDSFFLDCVDELYRTIEKDQNYAVSRKISSSGRLKPWLIRKLSNFSFLYKLRLKLGNRQSVNFASMISGDFRIIVPASLFSRHNYIYMYDVWPRFQRWIFPLLDVFNITYVFFSSRQVYEDYVRKSPNNKCKAMWLPEALNADEYQFREPGQRGIDVLEFGRNYEAYHHLITATLQQQGKKHVFKVPGQPILFEGKQAFTEALAQSKIVICIPSDITHPERAEYISTMTLRYLQAMASKCLIVGIMPSDMEAAFGYNPIVEIDMDNAAAQIIAVLDNYNAYRPLIEKNYQEVKAKHQWTNRWEVIREKIEENL
jgi:hypothetical protein